MRRFNRLLAQSISKNFLLNKNAFVSKQGKLTFCLSLAERPFAVIALQHATKILKHQLKLEAFQQRSVVNYTYTH
jgi:hypothetical protein